MFGFFRRKKKETVETFVEATGGGWFDSPEVVAIDGGSQASFVDQTLERARAHALENKIPIGKEFEFTITDIPAGISGPHEIVFGLMVQAQRYGLTPGAVINEKAFFTRFE